MTCHPDKCPNDSAATAKFQKLSRAHSVLSDPEKRSLYDEAGIVDDGDDGDVAGGGGVGEGAWEAYFRAMFPAVTLAKVEAFAAEYRGSEEERGHVLDAYAEGNGASSRTPAPPLSRSPFFFSHCERTIPRRLRPRD